MSHHRLQALRVPFILNLALARGALGSTSVALTTALAPAGNAAARCVLSGGRLLSSLGQGEKSGRSSAGDGSLLFLDVCGSGLLDLGGGGGGSVGRLDLRSGDGGGGSRDDHGSVARGDSGRDGLRLGGGLRRRELTVSTTSRQSLKLTLSTLANGLSVDLGAGTVAFVHALVLLADILGLTARAADGSLVTEVGVDADEVGSHAVGADVLNNDLAGRLGLVVGAVTAAAVQLTGVDDGKVLDGDGSGTVVLDDLVLGLLGSSADDGGVTGTEDGDGVLADVAEPDVSQCAGTCMNISGDP